MINKIKVFGRFSGLILFILMGFSFSPSAFANSTQEGELHQDSTAVVANSEAHVGQESEATHEEKKLDVGKMILEHILDSHDWHLWGEGHHSVSVPLPVIIYSDKGFDFFMSSAFHHGESTVKGRYNYRLEKQKIVAVDESDVKSEETTSKLIDFSITKNVAAMFVSIILLLLIFRGIAKAYTRNVGKAPSGMQSLIEPIIIFIRDEVAKVNIGEKKYEKYMPYLLTVFFFIWINNLLGLIPIIPGGANVTGNIAVTLVLATITFLITTIKANKDYWRHIFAMPGVPIGVLFILTPIEILGMFIRPFVLMLRLFANITAGHIVILSFISLIFIFGEQSAAVGWGVSPLSVLFVVFMSVLELLVALLQAYVFTLLSSIYIGSAIAEHHHEEHH